MHDNFIMVFQQCQSVILRLHCKTHSPRSSSANDQNHAQKQWIVNVFDPGEIFKLIKLIFSHFLDETKRWCYQANSRNNFVPVGVLRRICRKISKEQRISDFLRSHSYGRSDWRLATNYRAFWTHIREWIFWKWRQFGQDLKVKVAYLRWSIRNWSVTY